MSPRRKQGRPDNIVAWLYADPWRKLGAIALALVSWEYLDKRVNAEHMSYLEIRLPGQAKTGVNNYLRIAIDSKDFTLTPEDVLDAGNDQPLPEQGIKVELKGEKATIDRMKGTLQLVFSPTNKQLERAAKEGSLTFGMGDLLHEKTDLISDLQSLDAVKITPDRIRLRIRPNATKNLPLAKEHVQLDFGTSGLEERLSLLEFSHPSVDLRGPKEAIQNLPATGAIFLGRVGDVQPDATTIRIDLELLPSHKGIVTSKVYATYAVEPDWQPVEFKNVPVDIDNRLLAPGQKQDDPFRVEPAALDSIKLHVKGDLASQLRPMNAQDLAAFARRHLRLAVYPTPTDLTRKEAWPVKPKIGFVLFEDMPTPRKGKDFKVVFLESVNLIRKSEEKK